MPTVTIRNAHCTATLDDIDINFVGQWDRYPAGKVTVGQLARRYITHRGNSVIPTLVISVSSLRRNQEAERAASPTL